MALSANNPKPFLTLDCITIRLRNRFVFEGTSCQIKSDEQRAVIGPNGAGKSTLVKAIAGDVPIVRGRVVYHFMNEFGFDSLSAEQDGERSVAEAIR